MKLDPGDVALAAIPGVKNAKPRPAIVVSTALYQATRGDVIIGIVTTQLARATDPTDYVLQDWKAAGLHSPSAYRTFLYSMPTTDVHHVIGKLTDRDWAEVQARLRIGLAVT
jgi:mRNA interferase MazF